MSVDEQKQEEDLEYHKLLGLVMWKWGIPETTVTTEEMAEMGRTFTDGLVVVIGPNPDPQTIRIRLMSESDAEGERMRGEEDQ